MRKVEYSFCRIKLELCSYLADFVHLNNEQKPLLFDFYLSLFIFIQTDPFTRTYLRISAYYLRITFLSLDNNLPSTCRS